MKQKAKDMGLKGSFYVKISLEAGNFYTQAALLGSSSPGRDRRSEKLHAGGGYREWFPGQVQQEPGRPPRISCPEGEMHRISPQLDAFLLGYPAPKEKCIQLGRAWVCICGNVMVEGRNWVTLRSERQSNQQREKCAPASKLERKKLNIQQIRGGSWDSKSAKAWHRQHITYLHSQTLCQDENNSWWASPLCTTQPSSKNWVLELVKMESK